MTIIVSLSDSLKLMTQGISMKIEKMEYDHIIKNDDFF